MFPFGFDWKLKNLRKKWCKLRLKALKMEKEERKTFFDMLDDVEQELRTLEEEELTRADRARILERVENGLKEIEEIIKPRKEKEFNF